MRVTCRVDVNTKAAEVRQRGEGFAAEFARTFAEEAAQVAKHRVSPNVGPGPHPHRPPPEFREHIDTGRLRDSIQVRSEHRGFLESCSIFSDESYAAHLELGFTSRAGRHWRYPFIMPSIEQVKHQADKIALSSARRWLSDTGMPYRGRVNISAPLSSTFFPE